ncbi:hypothetical protein BZG36_01382 [Bifiguratus adelaidae]|uniref:Squamous cell carcinoma antigen recognized by T-cells 3 n=1 Tax=Bifiguratus adelaidae TaxID=1938954 RepID=A0A261Y3B1_9FUNG|nr:hypothetical protein BZG36_01382 [Bifiguratus adelaidae]
MVHTQKNKLVFYEPEPGYWMHMSVELGTATRQGKDMNGKDKVFIDYLEQDLNDRALEGVLRAGYDMFKLWHGTFARFLRPSSPRHGVAMDKASIRQLMNALEDFFVDWIWKWDFSQLNNVAPYLVFDGLTYQPTTRKTYLQMQRFCEEMGSAFPDVFNNIFLWAPTGNVLWHSKSLTVKDLCSLHKLVMPILNVRKDSCSAAAMDAKRDTKSWTIPKTFSGSNLLHYFKTNKKTPLSTDASSDANDDDSVKDESSPMSSEGTFVSFTAEKAIWSSRSPKFSSQDEIPEHPTIYLDDAYHQGHLEDTVSLHRSFLILYQTRDGLLWGLTVPTQPTENSEKVNDPQFYRALSEHLCNQQASQLYEALDEDAKRAATSQSELDHKYKFLYFNQTTKAMKSTIRFSKASFIWPYWWPAEAVDANSRNNHQEIAHMIQMKSDFEKLPSAREIYTKSTSNCWVLGVLIGAGRRLTSPEPSDSGHEQGNGFNLAEDVRELYLIVPKKEASMIDAEGKAKQKRYLSVCHVQVEEEAKAPVKEREEDVVTEEHDESSTDLLAQVAEAIEQLARDPYQYDKHVALIQSLRTLGMFEELRNAREQMRQLFPLSEALWTEWIEDEKSMALDKEGKELVLNLYTQAQQDYLSIPLWKEMLEYVFEEFNNEEEEEADDRLDIDLNKIRELMKEALLATQYHFTQSQQVWRVCLDFEMNQLEKHPEYKEEQRKRLNDMFARRTEIPHSDLEETWTLYSTFVSETDSEHFEERMVQATKAKSATLKRSDDLDKKERELASIMASENRLDGYHYYIDKETHQKKPDLFTLSCLYERAISEFYLDPSIWLEYVGFMLEHFNLNEAPLRVCQRAIRNCPWSGDIWTSLFQIMESRVTEHDIIEENFQRAIQHPLLSRSPDDYIKVLVSRCDYYRRRALGAEAAERNLEQFVLVLEESTLLEKQVLPEGDPTYRLQRYQSHIQETLFQDTVAATKTWDAIIKSHGKESEAFLSYIEFAKRHQDYRKVRSLFKQASIKLIDWPERIWDAWIQFEHLYGSADTLLEAVLRTDRQRRIVNKKRAEEAYNMSQAQVAQAAVQEQKTQRNAERMREFRERKKDEKQETQQQARGTKRQGHEGHRAQDPTSRDAKRTKTTETENPNGTSSAAPTTTSFLAPRTVNRPNRPKKRGFETVSRKTVQSASIEGKSQAIADKKGKSNDDFRAMLQGKQ